MVARVPTTPGAGTFCQAWELESETSDLIGRLAIHIIHAQYRTDVLCSDSFPTTQRAPILRRYCAKLYLAQYRRRTSTCARIAWLLRFMYFFAFFCKFDTCVNACMSQICAKMPKKHSDRARTYNLWLSQPLLLPLGCLTFLAKE